MRIGPRPDQPKNPEEVVRQIVTWFNMRAGDISREVFWDDHENRFEVIRRDLDKGKTSDLYNLAYKEWKVLTGRTAGPGLKEGFRSAFDEAVDLEATFGVSSDAEAMREVFDRQSVRREVMSLFKREYGVVFKKGTGGFALS